MQEKELALNSFVGGEAAHKKQIAACGGGQFVRLDFVSWICELNSAK